MACVLALSSQVIRGHVGLSAIVPALRRMGHEVWPMPTVMLSNHPGHARSTSMRVGAEDLGRMLDSLAANGWLDQVDAVISGYLPSQDHVRIAASLAERLKAARPTMFLCDPVIGDEPKGIYIDTGAARAIRDALLPLADIATPNRFELGWLTGAQVGSLDEVERAVRALGPETVVATSAAVEGGRIANLMVAAGTTFICNADYVGPVPHGAGDILAALFLGARLAGQSPETALGRAVAGVDQVIAASRGRDELELGAAAGDWVHAEPRTVLIPARALRIGAKPDG
jgi:pyridoxine kinase